jgi:hypothetical protein
VIGLTRVLAWEAGEFGITVNVIMPGLIGTEHVLRMFDDEVRTDAFFADALSKQCIKRRGQPLDIAHGIAYLASQEAVFVTGQTLQVGGGFGFSTWRSVNSGLRRGFYSMNCGDAGFPRAMPIARPLKIKAPISEAAAAAWAP